MKSSILALIAPLLAVTGSTNAAPAATDPSIILGKEFTTTKGVSKYVAWPSNSDPCSVATIIASASPVDQTLFGHPFTAGTNPNFTNVVVTNDFLPGIEPVKKGASPSQLCIALTPNNRTCPAGTKFQGIFEADFLCGGPLTTG